MDGDKTVSLTVGWLSHSVQTQTTSTVAIAILAHFFFRTEASGSRINTARVALLICKADTVVVCH